MSAVRKGIPALGLVMLATACSSEVPLHISVPENAILLAGPSVYLGEGRTLNDALVVLEGDRIVAVTTLPRVEYSVPESAMVIDLRGRTIVPGFIDLHTHLGADGCFAGSMTEARLRR